MSEVQVVEELRKKVALSCRMLGTRGVTRGAYGHVSARIPGTDRILIKSKGAEESGMEFATEKDVITIDLSGKVLEAPEGLGLPGETDMHLVVYTSRPEVMSVIHSHPDWLVALMASEKPLLPIYAAYSPESVKLLMQGIPIYPRSVTIINKELAEDFMRVMGKKKACLLLGHGMTTAGESVEEATWISLNIFELARMNFLAYTLGNPKPIPEKDLNEYNQRWEQGVQPRSRESRYISVWRYNENLLKR